MNASKRTVTVEFDGSHSTVVETKDFAGIVTVFDQNFLEVFPMLSITSEAVVINFFTLEVTTDPAEPLLKQLYPPGLYKVVLID